MTQIITLATNTGETQQLFPLERPSPIATAILVAEPSASIDEILAADEARFKEAVLVPFWREAVAAYRGKAEDINPLQLHVVATSSYAAQAVRQQLPNTDALLPYTIGGVIRSQDNRVILGIRRGFIEAEKGTLLPLGYLSWGKSLQEQTEAEGSEEIGIVKEHYVAKNILGHQTDPEFTRGVNVVVCCDVNINFKEILEMHQQALTIAKTAYEQAISQGRVVARKKAKAAVRTANLPSIDAMDNHPLLAIPDTRTALAAILAERRISADGREYPIMGLTMGALMLYLHHQN